MAESKSTNDSQEAHVGRRMLAHVEHLRSLGVAFTNAAGAYAGAHEASEQGGTGWHEEFPQNHSGAAEELHREIFAAPQRIFEIAVGSDAGQKAPASKRRTDGKKAAK